MRWPDAGGPPGGRRESAVSEIICRSLGDVSTRRSWLCHQSIGLGELLVMWTDLPLRCLGYEGYADIVAMAEASGVIERGQEAGLARSEVLSIFFYTYSSDADPGRIFNLLNDVLRSPSSYLRLLPEVLDFRQKLCAALFKLPPAAGEYLRRLTLPDAALAEAEAGGRFRDAAFLSCSDQPVAFAGRDLLTIYGRSARMVEAYSSKPDEHEALFLPGTEFRVEGIRRVGSSSVLRLVEK